MSYFFAVEFTLFDKYIVKVNKSNGYVKKTEVLVALF